MKYSLIVLVLALVVPITSQAACYGSDSFQTCSDTSGNTYNIQRFGDMTQVQGHNARTGSNWNQTSQQFGDTTQTYGTAANGNSWNATTFSSPGMSTTYGTDSDGNSFSSTCTAYGCY